ncbi:hypothetical protein QZH41_013176 [Actinostola sp. cb2023]|nr:hypothetical protein QZH41_013176 [Actinostola sp. cb2023]
MDKILRGIVKFRNTVRLSLLPTLKKVASKVKGMEGLYNTTSAPKSDNTSMVTSWITTHGKSSLTKLDQLIVNADNPVKLIFNEENNTERFEAVIDEKLCIVDKLSQINVLQQLQNIGSYSFVREQLRAKQLNLHALWFDIANGEMYMFSRENGTFEVVNEDTIDTVFKSV